MSFPGGPYRFGFSVVDDTDFARLETVKPVYDLLAKLGMRTTKTVWPLRGGDPRNPNSEAHNLEDARYAEWVRALSQDGFEIAIHGASAESNLRSKTILGLEKFAQVLGHMPTLHINHSRNRDNLYWGVDRFDSAVMRIALRCAKGKSRERFEGHRPESAFFWGDLCLKYIRYCRNMTFPRTINLCSVNPTMPYWDKNRPYVRRWFSSCDAANPQRFGDLLSTKNLERLQDERGICILYTHFGAGFAEGGSVIPPVEAALRRLASLPGRFLPATELLDEMSGTGPDAQAPSLPEAERRRMESTWFVQKLLTGGTS
jgi:hypothetical protein